ncbi:hypothetical protein F5Y16DRAFT_355303 [Xylariaceae sp. FL0255]|nr:hypothetical protein F5Y16DRAFT_355303 [Xylariaceae sp. FL0255]
MASSNLISRFAILYTLFTSLILLTKASTPPSVPSPAAEPELICHTNNPAECYPKVFSATEEFQIVHDDQDLPPGLHVQLDIQTGQKQAKLYDPNDEHPEVAGLPVNQEVIVVDPDSSDDRDTPRIPPGAPAYEPVGVVKQPPEKNQYFSKALMLLKQSPVAEDLGWALELLGEESHDMYYGLQIAEDTHALQSLFCLLLEEGDMTEKIPFHERYNFQASSTLSSLLRNNAPALRALENSWESIMRKECKTLQQTIGTELFQQLTPTSEMGSFEESREIDQARIIIPVISGLLKSPRIRDDFLNNGGMQTFLSILLRQGEMWEKTQGRVAQIVSDTFLDEDFGATLGVWPLKPQRHSDHCARKTDDECWEYQLERIHSEKQTRNWSGHLLKLLKKQTQPQVHTSRGHDEL